MATKLKQNLNGPIVLGFLFVVLGGCASPNKGSNASTDQMEVSLTEDRSELQDLRKDIPLEKRQENDELAFILKILNDNPNDRPDKIRRKYDRAHSRARDTFRKNTTKTRDIYTKAERKKREAFLKKLKKDRDKFNSQKWGREERSAFYSDQDSVRKEFFANERDARKEFEAEQRQKSDDFNGKMRETRRQFYDLYNSYNKKYYEREALEKKQKRLNQKQNRNDRPTDTDATFSSPTDKKLQEFSEIDKIPSQNLSTDDQ